MDRRGFFRAGVKTVTRAVARGLHNRMGGHHSSWVRPPYALDEAEFLEACTRCDKCVDACPHQVIFLLPAGRGAILAGTPALDLLNKGCRLCKDWPCVSVCEPRALKFPETGEAQEPPLPRLSRARINPEVCLPYNGPECGACAASCPVPGAMVWHGTKPLIDPDKCTGCALCREDCIVEPKAVEIRI